MLRWIIFLLFFAIVDFYAFQAIKTITKAKWIYITHFSVSLLVVGNFIFQFLQPSQGRVLTPEKSYAFGFLLTLMVLKLVVVPVLFSEDVFRFFAGTYNKFFSAKQSFHIPSRRKFISQLALGIAAIPVASLLYGMYKGKYNFRVLSYTLYFDDLPEAFDGYKITQISDIHSGSLDNSEKVAYAVDLINEQKSDAILFTGDLVNNLADEMEPWMDAFGRLNAKDGVYSVLGNHDYGDYVNWDDEASKIKNLDKLKTIQKQIGFDLLLNDKRFIKREGHRIALIGVENWGKGFKQKGDIDQALMGVSETDFKIVLSHDPTHWSEVLVPHKHHFHLTLSGHTHGMQFGIEIPGFIKWSPVKWRYKYWAGIYEEANQYINVNRGFGVLAYPGRVGIWPEISVIEIRKGSKPV